MATSKLPPLAPRLPIVGIDGYDRELSRALHEYHRLVSMRLQQIGNDVALIQSRLDDLEQPKYSVCTASIPNRTATGDTFYAMSLVSDTMGATISAGKWQCPKTGVYDILTSSRSGFVNAGGAYGFIKHNIKTNADDTLVTGEVNMPVDITIGLECRAVGMAVELIAGQLYQFTLDHFSGDGLMSASTVTIKFILRR